MLVRQEAALSDDDGPEYAPYLRLCMRGGEEALQIRNFVGVIEAPSGLQIEVLPKVGEDAAEARRLLLRMLRVGGAVPSSPARAASLRSVSLTLLDGFILEFLESVATLVRHGIASGYSREEGNHVYLRGRLLMAQQLRRNLVQANCFYTTNERFVNNMPENRLLRSALDLAARSVINASGQRLCGELVFAFDDVPPSTDITRDFERCTKDRSRAHYELALAWARLLLFQLSPISADGAHSVRALLFPMERVFEAYVARGLDRQLDSGVRLREQAGQHSLVMHRGRKLFQLRPDFLLQRGPTTLCVLDAKWKLLDTSQLIAGNKYGISQGDLYQLFAYGMKYLPEDALARTVILIYPKTAQFPAVLPHFEYQEGFRLWVVPFDLEACRLIVTEAWGDVGLGLIADATQF